MECGGLSVTDMEEDGTDMEEDGTPGMLLWCAGSCTSSMKVRKRSETYTYMYIFKHSTPTVSYKSLELVVCYSIVWVSGRNGGTIETTEL